MYVTVKDIIANKDGTDNVVLSCDGTDVLCENAVWFTNVENTNEELLSVFEEWFSMALIGEEGYAIL